MDKKLATSIGKLATIIGMDIWLATIFILSALGQIGSLEWWLSVVEFGLNTVLFFLSDFCKEL
jgi:hypothetical protein